MQRAVHEVKIKELIDLFPIIEFPEYQREPDVWSEDQKQRLIDSILRNFDISSVYVYERSDGGLECIDGRQRLNAIMSFLGENPPDDHNRFRIKFENEVTDDLPNEFEPLGGLRFADLDSHGELGAKAMEGVLEYPISFVHLEGAHEGAAEFNLQFLRLNLGTLINAGEKLHAMVGSMRNAIFLDGGVGKHSFLESVNIPTRRYAREQTAAQILLQAFSFEERGEFARARHFDLQKFLKQNAELMVPHPLIGEVVGTLDALDGSSEPLVGSLKNRAMTVSVVLRAWRMRLFEADKPSTDRFVEFLLVFLARLRWQARNMRDYHASSTYGYLVEFQRHLTQASVEKPAVAARDRILDAQYAYWLDKGVLAGDVAYRDETGKPPPVA